MKHAAVVVGSGFNGMRRISTLFKYYALLVNVLVLISLSFISAPSFAQDIWLQNHFTPASGCNLSSTQVVYVLINNNSGSFIPASSVNVSYTVDGGPATTETLGSFLNPGASWNFSFGTPANLSACGPHTMKVWVSYAGDLNHLNDTLTWAVQNDCTIIPGTVTADVTVCEGSNSGILNLTGWTNGTIANWEYSINGGTNWTSIANTTTSQNFLDVTTTTMYRVQLEGGYCPDDVSGSATVTTQAPPVAGSVNGDMTLCETAGDGNLSLVGTVGAVNFWESSDDLGTNWNNLTNTTTSLSFTGLTTEHWYRAQIEGGVCPDVWTDTAVISIDASSVPGTMLSDQSICVGGTANLSVNGNNGAVIDWEYSEDMVSWSPIANTTTTYTTPNLLLTTYYRANVQNGVCPPDVTNVATITITPEPVGGQLNTDITVCKAVANGMLNLNGFSGTIVDWEQSTDYGLNWTSLGNLTSLHNYSGLNDTTWFRVIIDGGPCGTTYSDTAVINVVEDSYGGVLSIDTMICEGDFAELTLSGAVGNSILWQSSTDMVTWTPFATTQTVLTVSPTTTTYYQATVQNLNCPSDQSNNVTVVVFPLPAVDAGLDVQMLEGDTIQLNGTGVFAGIWTPPYNMSDQNLPDPLCWPTVTTTYTYTVISTDGCVNADDVMVTVEPLAIPFFDIKNVITANNDGYNDVWIIEGIEDYPFTEVAVFNIYGVEVYSSRDYQNDWAGTAKGKQLPDGTYYYRVLIDGEEWKGNLTILGNE